MCVSVYYKSVVSVIALQKSTKNRLSYFGVALFDFISPPLEMPEIIHSLLVFLENHLLSALLCYSYLCICRRRIWKSKATWQINLRRPNTYCLAPFSTTFQARLV